MENEILQPFFIKVYQETCNAPSIKPQVRYLNNFLSNWAGDFLHPLGDNLHRAGKLNSIWYCYLSSQTLVFEWLSTTLLCGSYDVVMRELRSILEGMFPAFYLDVANPDESLEFKMKRLRELEGKGMTYGKKAFRGSTIGGWQDFYRLYQELCAYTHISFKVLGKKMNSIADQGYPESLEFEFDQTAFLACVTMWHKISDLALNSSLVLMERLNVPYEEGISLPPPA
jgi:hypothetical protein